MMSRNPTLIPATTLAAGILVSSATGAAWWCGIIPMAAAICLYLLIMRKSGNPVAAFRYGKWHPAWTALLFIGIGMVDEGLSRPYDTGYPKSQQAECEVTGILSKTYGDRVDLLIRGTNGAKAQIRTGVTSLQTGDIVLIPAQRLTETCSDTSAYGRRLAPMLKAKGVMYTGWIPAKEIIPAGHSGALRYRLANVRGHIETEIEKSKLRKPTADFLNAILMGDKSGLDSDVRMTFANGGTAHMLALSGLHMGILAGLLMWLMLPLRAIGRYKTGYGLAIAILWIYVLLTGMSPSSVRACIMISFAFLAIIIERKNSIAAALTSACLLILIADPHTLFDAGFQLSVICVASLIAFASTLNPIDHRSHPRIYRVCEALLATMTTTASSWALVSYYFGQIPLMFLPTNLLLLPLLPIYLGVAAVYVVFVCMGVDFCLIASFLDRGYDFLIWATETLSGESQFVVEYQLPLAGAAAWIFALGAAAIAINLRKHES